MVEFLKGFFMKFYGLKSMGDNLISHFFEYTLAERERDYNVNVAREKKTTYNSHSCT